MEPLYVEFVNNVGRKMYQPKLDTGERARHVWNSRKQKYLKTWVRGNNGEPVLYRTVGEAERFARREIRSRERALQRQFKEVRREDS